LPRPRGSRGSLQAIARSPSDWIEGYRHLSGSLAASGDTDGAIAFARKASGLAPDNFDFALHAGCLLLDAQRADEAALYLEQAINIEPLEPRALRALSAADHMRDRPHEAIDLALRAAALAPADSGIAIHAGEMLLRADRVDDALALLKDAARREPTDAALWRMISAGRVGART